MILRRIGRLAFECLEVRNLLSFSPPSFLISQNVPEDNGFSQIETGDFNGDGFVDLAIFNSKDTPANKSIDVFKGNAIGQYSPFSTPSFLVATSNQSLALHAKGARFFV